VASRFFRLRECEDDRLRLGQRCLYADMDRCTARCETEDEAAYAKEVERVRAFLTGRDCSVLEQLRTRMRQAAEEHDFEKAAQFRDTIEPLERILAKQAVVGAPVRRHNAALVHRRGGGEVDVLFVRFGRFVESMSFRVPPVPTKRGHLADRCRAHFDPDADPPSDFSKRAAHEIRLLLHWVYAHRDEITRVRWQPGRGATDVAEAVERAMGEPVETEA